MQLPQCRISAQVARWKAGITMSRTDKDRPYWVRSNDPTDPQSTGVSHYHRLHARGECDEHVVTDQHDHRNTYCASHLTFHTYTTSPRSYHARIWYRQERAAQRVIKRTLTRAANSGWLDDAEDMIDNRQTHVGSYYHGGWWD